MGKIIDSKIISKKTTSLEAIEKLPVVKRVLKIERLSEVALIHSRPKKIMIGTSKCNKPFLKKMSDEEIDKLLRDTEHKMSDDRKIIPTVITMREVGIVDPTNTD